MTTAKKQPGNNSGVRNQVGSNKPNLRPTSVDLLLAALSPALIIGMIACLVFFLLTLIYEGDFTIRLMYILGLYTFASVLIARIAIEQNRALAMGYMLAMGAAAMLVTMRFIQFPSGLQIFAFPIVLGFLILIAVLADRITFDCTVIDDQEDSSGEGLLQSLGLLKSQLSSAKSNAEAPPQARAVVKKKKRKHNPGVWVLYFSLLAIPLFGIGQLFMTTGDSVTRGRSFVFLFGYLLCALSLLVVTSFLNLRRYLRQRNVAMPADMTITWLSSGIIGVVVLLLVAMLLPLPGRAYGLFGLPFKLTSGDLKASKWGWGPEGVRDSSVKSSVAPPDLKGGNSSTKSDRPKVAGGNDSGSGEQSSKPKANGQGQPSNESGGNQPGGNKPGGQGPKDGNKNNSPGKQDSSGSGSKPSESGESQSSSGQGSKPDPSQSGSAKDKQSSQSSKNQNESNSQSKTKSDGQQPSNSSQSKDQQQAGSQESSTAKAQSPGDSGKQPNSSKQDQSQSGKQDESGKQEQSQSAERKSQQNESGDKNKSEQSEKNSQENSQNQSEQSKSEPSRKESDQSDQSNDPTKSEENSDSGEQQKDQQEADSNKNKREENNDESKIEEKKQQEKSQNSEQQKNKTQENTQPKNQSASNWNLLSKLPNLTSLVKVITALILLGIIFVYLLLHGRELLAAFRSWLDRLFGPEKSAEKSSKTPSSVKSEDRNRQTAFSSFINPFARNVAEGSQAEIVRYTFDAVQAWGNEHGAPRQVEETPEEYLKRLARQYPVQSTQLQSLGSLYYRLAYANRQIRIADIDPLRKLCAWLWAPKP